MGIYLNADCMDLERGLPSFPDNHFDLAIVDPPYRSTLDYHGSRFDNDRFEDFARSLKCPVFISEYSPAIKGFQVVMKVGKLSTMNNKGVYKAQKQRWEYLHWNGIS